MTEKRARLVGRLASGVIPGGSLAVEARVKVCVEVVGYVAVERGRWSCWATAGGIIVRSDAKKQAKLDLDSIMAWNPLEGQRSRFQDAWSISKYNGAVCTLSGHIALALEA